MRNWKLGLLSLMMVALMVSCAKEDKKDDVTAKLNGTTWLMIKKVVEGTEQTLNATTTITFAANGDFIYSEVSLDSTSTTDIESSWEVNTAGTQIDVTLFGDFEISELTNTKLSWEYTDTDENFVEETYAKQ